MERWAGKIAVVTGASSGNGLAIAKALLKHDVVVIGFARRKNVMQAEMQNVKGKDKGKFYPVECDVTKPESIEQAFQWVKSNFGVVHILINNAGVSTNKKFMESSRQDWEKLFNTNVLGYIDCTKRAAKLMMDANVEGHIVNMNSTGGHEIITFDGMTVNLYPASKHATRAATEITHKEFYGSKIRVSGISPGLVATNITKANNFDLSNVNMNQPMLQPSDIADAVIYIIGTPQRVHICDLVIRPFGELKYEGQK